MCMLKLWEFSLQIATFILSFNITSDPASPITEGTAVTLTCTVKLNVTLMQPPAVSVSPVEKQSSK